jgi:Putative auto-transporter adhesin, head GIN domain
MVRVLLAALAASALFAAPAAADTRALSGFTKVSASAGTHVDIRVGPAFRVEVEGRDAARILTRVSNGTLVVEPVRGNFWRGRRDAIVRVSMPAVEGLDASSGAHIQAQGLSGGAVALGASSGARVEAGGVCASFTAQASSGAEIDAEALRCENGSVDVSSGARAEVFATGRLDVDASSGGDVTAFGNPGIGDISLSSGGSLRRR